MTTLILDTSNLLHRIYHALSVHMTPDAVLSAWRGSVRTQIAYHQQLSGARDVVAAVDAGPSWRHREYRAYKEGRADKDDVIREMLREGPALLRSLGVTVLRSPDHEADDVMATYAALLRTPCTLLTNDRDLLAAVTDRVHVHDPYLKRTLTPSDVQARLGVPPAKVAFLKSLTGDPSDNIPGVRGIGAKMGASLACQFDGPGPMFSAVEGLPTRQRTPLSQADPAQVALSLRLATLVTDAPLVEA